MTRFAMPIVIFAGLVGLFFFGLWQDPRELPSTLIGRPAPSFDLPSLKDPATRISTEDLKGQVSLLNVWATWCVGCRQEHGFLMTLAESGGVPIYGLNWRDNRDAALSWLQQYGDPYVASGFDADARVGIDWGVYGAPETFLLDANGIVLHRHTGPLNGAIWERDFVPLIAAARSDG